MNKRCFKWLFLLCLCNSMLFSSCSQQNDPAFYNDIQEFKKADRRTAPPKNAILFVGSSSFTMWKDVDTYFPGYTIINRGFGGSTLPDVIRYANDIILPYEPRQVVIYCGENDIAGGEVTAEQVLERFTTLFNAIRNKLPKTSVVFVSMKPSPSREKFMTVMEDANIMIRQFLSGYSNTAYVDVYHLMLDSGNKPRKELFLEDDLHMNKQGYAIWKEAIAPHLMR